MDLRERLMVILGRVTPDGELAAVDKRLSGVERRLAELELRRRKLDLQVRIRQR